MTELCLIRTCRCLDCGRKRRKTTWKAATCRATRTWPVPGVRRPGTAGPDASSQEQPTSRAETAGDTESTEIRTACRSRQHPACTYTRQPVYRDIHYNLHQHTAVSRDGSNKGQRGHAPPVRGLPPTGHPNEIFDKCIWTNWMKNISDCMLVLCQNCIFVHITDKFFSGDCHHPPFGDAWSPHCPPNCRC